jgi:hypothetical protein
MNNRPVRDNMTVEDYLDVHRHIENAVSRSDSPVLTTGDVSDHITSKLMLDRWDRGVNTHADGVKLLCTRRDWSRWARVKFKEWHFHEINEESGIIQNPITGCMIHYYSRRDNMNVNVFGELEEVHKTMSSLLSEFTELDCYIDWVYSADGHQIRVPVNSDRMPVQEMYPFLEDEQLTDYYDRFMESNSNILLLIGPPGTGKTSFIRGLLHHCKTSAMVTYDSGILEKDMIFATFLESDSKMMVLEDSDNFLMSRNDGNTMMHKFLNVGDGLVSLKDKKLIFTTNLPNVKDVDQALIRPGRCFDVLEFGSLTLEQSVKAAAALGLEEPSGKDAFTVAELFHSQTYKPKVKKMGFV